MQNFEYEPIVFHSSSPDFSVEPQPPAQPAACVPVPELLPFVRQVITQLDQAAQDRAAAMVETDRLQRRLVEKEAKEFAYRSAIEADDCVITWSESGKPVRLLNRRIEWAAHLRPQPPFSGKAAYLVKLCGVAQEVVWGEQEFQKDTAFLQALYELPGVQVGFVRSAKRTATLLRQAISAKIQVVVPAFWGGWFQTEAGDHRFYQLSPSTTHSDGARLGTLTEAIGHPAPAVAAIAARQFWPRVQVVREPMTRWLLTVWFHASALTTLLDQFGYPLPLALCIFAADASWRDYLCGLFRWFGDPELSLDLPPAAFSQGLLCRKDEPLMVLDQHRTANAAANTSLLEQVLVNGQIPWKSGRESSYFPLQALPVILTSAASALSCAPETIVLELARDGLDTSAASAKSAEPLNLSHDYLRSFIGFAADHVEQFRDIMECSMSHAYQNAGDRLTEKCARAFGVLLGASSFLQDFLRCCGFKLPDFTDVEDEWESWLLALLEQTSEKELDCTDLADQFVAIARSQLLSGTLQACPTEYRSLPDSDIVFFDDRSLGFTAEAFRQVCRQLSSSRPLVLQALRQAGLLQGRPVNATTGLTRISIWNAFGIRETRQVYKLSREAFDQLGEPLIFAEEAEV